MNAALLDFKSWLLEEAQRPIDQHVLDSYDRAFAEKLEQKIAATPPHSELRRTYERMRACPIRDGKGRCHSWSSYILTALLRANNHHRIDPEPALSHIIWRMLKPNGVFDFTEDRPVPAGANPIEARLKTFLKRDLINISSGRMPRLEKTQRFKSGTTPADNVPARQSGHEQEMINDLYDLIARKNSTLPLRGILQGMIQGETQAQQRRLYGRQADIGRQIIRQIVRDYAQSSGNSQLLRLLEPTNRQEPERGPKSTLSPQIADYLSIIQAMEDKGGEVGLADLTRKRRRWLDMPPRDSNSPHRNRLYDTVAKMVEDRVLTKQNGKYVPGPRFQEFADLRGQVTGRRLSM